MLVLSRKKNEKIRINNDITIAVIEIRGDKVRLGVEAPKSIPVHREEVWLAIREQQGGRHYFAHLFEDGAFLGCVKFSSESHAEDAVRIHNGLKTGNTGKVSTSEEP